MPARRLLATIAAVALLIAGAAGTAAQDATPGPVSRGAAYPVSIHLGTCQAPVAQPVGEVVDTTVAGAEEGAEFAGARTGAPVLVATTEVDGPLATFTISPHVVAVHASPQDYGTIVACGEIAGYDNDGTIIFPIRGVGDAAVSGVAILSEDETLLDKLLAGIDESLVISDDTLSLTVFVIAGDET